MANSYGYSEGSFLIVISGHSLKLRHFAYVDDVLHASAEEAGGGVDAGHDGQVTSEGVRQHRLGLPRLHQAVQRTVHVLHPEL